MTPWKPNGVISNENALADLLFSYRLNRNGTLIAYLDFFMILISAVVVVVCTSKMKSKWKKKKNTKTTNKKNRSALTNVDGKQIRSTGFRFIHLLTGNTFYSFHAKKKRIHICRRFKFTSSFHTRIEVHWILFSQTFFFFFVFFFFYIEFFFTLIFGRVVDASLPSQTECNFHIISIFTHSVRRRDLLITQRWPLLFCRFGLIFFLIFRCFHKQNSTTFKSTEQQLND